MKEIKLLVDDRAGAIVVTAIGTVTVVFEEKTKTITNINTETIELAKLKNNTYKMNLFKEVNKNDSTGSNRENQDNNLQ